MQKNENVYSENNLPSLFDVPFKFPQRQLVIIIEISKNTENNPDFFTKSGLFNWEAAMTYPPERWPAEYFRRKKA